MENITPYSEVSTYQPSFTSTDVSSAVQNIGEEVQNTIDEDNLRLVNNAAQTGEDLIRNQGNYGSNQTLSHLDVRV